MNAPVILRATLYAVPLFLSPFADKLVDVLFKDEWPSPQKVVGCSIIGFIGMAIGLRAYFDGSAERLKQADSQPSTPNSQP